MKSCPTCNRTYPDDTLAFCLIDGSVLSAPYDARTEQPRGNEPPPTERLQSTPRGPETAPPKLPQTMPTSPPVYAVNRQPGSNSSGKQWLAVGIAAFLVLIVGFVLLLAGGIWINSRNSREQNRELKADIPTASKTSEGTPVPESSPSPTKLDVAGRWVGISDGSPATLVINNSEGDSYEGIETAGVGNVRIAVDVQVDPETRQITINETRVINGEGWNLGTNDGRISSDGNKMSGTARDAKGKTYSWSFTRQ